MNALQNLYASQKYLVSVSLVTCGIVLRGKKKGKDLKAAARAADYMGKGQTYYDAYIDG